MEFLHTFETKSGEIVSKILSKPLTNYLNRTDKNGLTLKEITNLKKSLSSYDFI